MGKKTWQRIFSAIMIFALAVGFCAVPVEVNAYQVNEKPLSGVTKSWIGNDFPGTEDNGPGNGERGKWVQNQVLDADFVNGTIVTCSLYDEGGRCSGLYRNGNVNANTLRTNPNRGPWGWGTASTAVAANETDIWLFNQGQDLLHYTWNYTDLESHRYVGYKNASGNTPVISMKVKDGTLYGLRESGDVDVWDGASLNKIRSFRITGAKRLVISPNADEIWAIVGNQIINYDLNGNALGRSIRNAGMPSNISIDEKDGQLVVCDNGPRQQVLFYDISGTGTPKIVRTLGDKGGISSGRPGEYTPGKLFAIKAAGTDKAGNIYVAMNQGYLSCIIRSYKPDGTLNWENKSLHFTDCATFMPGTDGTEIYTTDEILSVDYSKSKGKEATLKAITYDIFQDPGADVSTRSNVWATKLEGKRVLYMNGMYSNPRQSDVDVGLDMYVFKDDNSDISTYVGTFINVTEGMDVDNNGTIWTWRDGKVVAYYFVGFDENLCPIYTEAFSKSYALPANFNKVERVLFDDENQILYISGYNSEHWSSDWGRIGLYVEAYDWNDGNPTVRFKKLWPSEPADVGVTGPKAFEVAGDYVFAVTCHSKKVHVLSNKDLSYVGTMQTMPELGDCGWIDIPYGIRAMQRQNGEYEILVEEDWRAKNILYRWNSGDTTGPEPVNVDANVGVMGGLGAVSQVRFYGREMTDLTGTASIQSDKIRGLENGSSATLKNISCDNFQYLTIESASNLGRNLNLKVYLDNTEGEPIAVANNMTPDDTVKGHRFWTLQFNQAITGTHDLIFVADVQGINNEDLNRFTFLGTISDCVDTDPRDHVCDECGATVGIHADGSDANHTCDYCGGAIDGDVCVDTNPKDNKCDECGEALIATFEWMSVHEADYFDNCGFETVDAEQGIYKIGSFENDYREFRYDDVDTKGAVCLLVKTSKHMSRPLNMRVYVDSVSEENMVGEVIGLERYMTDQTGTNPNEHFAYYAIKLNRTLDGTHPLILTTVLKSEIPEGINSNNEHIFAVKLDSEFNCSYENETCADAADDGDHKCDKCGAENVTACADAGKDHICDTDSACTTYSTGSNAHADDIDDNHACDYCGGEVDGEVCVDAKPKDHVCDECGATDIGIHADSDDANHTCDYCGGAIDGDVCVDTNPKDHKCDECGERGMGTHADGDDADLNCDYCGSDISVFEWMSVNEADHFDNCGVETVDVSQGIYKIGAFENEYRVFSYDDVYMEGATSLLVKTSKHMNRPLNIRVYVDSIDEANKVAEVIGLQRYMTDSTGTNPNEHFAYYEIELDSKLTGTHQLIFTTVLKNEIPAGIETCNEHIFAVKLVNESAPTDPEATEPEATEPDATEPTEPNDGTSVKAEALESNVSIDGKLDEAFWTVQGTLKKQTGNMNIANTVTFGTAWDENYLYVGANVIDATVHGTSDVNHWDNDAIEVFIDGNNDKSGPYDAHDVQYLVAWGKDTLFSSAPGKDEGVLWAIEGTDEGYVVEMAVPWAVLDVEPELGMEIGFDVANDDRISADGVRVGSLTWAGDGNNYASTRNFGSLVLVDDIGETQPTEPEATEPEATEPEATEPEATEPEATEPEATEPEATEPEATEPEATEPEATEPEATEPEATEPEATEPEATEPEATEPEATEPEATEPEATEPEATEPEATEPTKPADPDSPSTGDSIFFWIPVFVVTLMAAAALVWVRRREA